MKLRNPVLLLLMIIAFASAGSGGFVSLAPNRLVTGTPVPVWHAIASPFFIATIVFAALLLALSFLPPWPRTHGMATIAAAILLLLLLAGAGIAAMRLTPEPGPARTSLGWAFWAMILCAGFAMIDAAQRLKPAPAMRLALAAVILLLLAALFGSGLLDHLSISREFATRRAVFAGELARHAVLVIGGIVPALVIGVPLGLWASRRASVRAPLFAALNLLQTIPSVALFGLLMAPLATLGLGGVGPAPAIIALALYGLLPVARNSLAGIEAADLAVIEAARSMGFTPGQIFWHVQLPLGLPIFLAGLRIVLVQTIGLAVIAALIGGGGLGDFIFQGIGQYAIDLVLLGAIPTTLIALAANFLLQVGIASLARRSAA